MQVNTQIVNEYDNPRLILLEQMNDACLALFSEYGLSLQLSNLTEQESIHTFTRDLGFVALISMTNSEIRLTIALQTRKDVLQDSFPVENKVTDNHELQDWIGELSNQLAGRIKNKMLGYGCLLDLGIPTVIQGKEMYLDLPRRSEISRYQFSSESGQVVLLSLSTLINSDYSLCAPGINEVTESLDEGELLFF